MKAKTPLAVGAVLIFAIVTLVFLIVRTNEGGMGGGDTYEVYADFDDANGLRDKTRVQISGVDVGSIKEIKHAYNESNRLVARVVFNINDDYPLYENASVRKVAVSLLGDFRIAVDPGSPDQARLKAGGRIPNVYGESDMQSIMSELKQVSQNVNKITDSMARVLSGPNGQGSLQEILSAVENSMQSVEQATSVVSDLMVENDRNIGQVIENLNDVTKAIASATAEGGSVSELMANLSAASAQITPVIESLKVMVDGDEDGKMGAIEQTVDNLNQTVNRLNEVAAKVNDGEGTVGRLVNDSKLIDTIEETVDGAADLVNSITGIKTEVELRTEYASPFNLNNPGVQGAVKNTVAVRIFPKPDKYYLIEVISDPRGQQQRKVVSTKDDSGNTTTEEVVTTEFGGLKFSAQFAKRFYMFTMRFGIIENTGGIGVNAHFLNDDLEFRIDAFDFQRRESENNSPLPPRLRGMAMYQIVDHIWLQAGIDDPFIDNLRTWFVGGVLRFDDDDLRSVIGLAGLAGRN